MDSLTQAAVGAVVGEILLHKKIGWRGMAWGAFLGTLPDLDVLALPFLDSAAGIYWHRGISHSILIMIVASLLLAWPMARLYSNHGVSAWRMGLLVFWAWSTHVLVDCFTTYGTQVFEPFSSYRVAMNTFFIVDPLFTLPLLVGLAIVLLAKQLTSQKRRTVMMGAVAVACCYLTFALVMKSWATRVIQAKLGGDIPDGKLVAVAPSSFNTILWRGLIETQNGYFLRYWSPWDDAQTSYEYFPKHHELASDYEGEEVLEALRWFACGHWVARKGDDGTLVIIDMRFTEIRDPGDGICRPIFQWHLRRDAQGHVHAPMLRPKGLNYTAAARLVGQRMLGDNIPWEKIREF